MRTRVDLLLSAVMVKCNVLLSNRDHISCCRDLNLAGHAFAIGDKGDDSFSGSLCALAGWKLSQRTCRVHG